MMIEEFAEFNRKIIFKIRQRWRRYRQKIRYMGGCRPNSTKLLPYWGTAASN